jgi:hypothetical protein
MLVLFVFSKCIRVSCTLSDIPRRLMREFQMLVLFVFSKCTLFQLDVFSVTTLRKMKMNTFNLFVHVYFKLQNCFTSYIQMFNDSLFLLFQIIHSRIKKCIIASFLRSNFSK